MESQFFENHLIQDFIDNFELFCNIEGILNQRFEVDFFVSNLFVSFRKDIIRVFFQLLVDLCNFRCHIFRIGLNSIKKAQILSFAFENVFKMI